MKLSKLNYQRNGIGGEGFFSVICTDWNDYKGEFLVTFITLEGDEIDSTSCRVVYLKDPKDSWRGDEMSCILQQNLDKLMRKYKIDNIYDLQKVIP
jgi:hypothetical protein